MEAVSEYSQLEVEEYVDGVTHSDVSRWQRGAFKRLSASKRRALRRFLEGPKLIRRSAHSPYESVTTVSAGGPRLVREVVGQYEPPETGRAAEIIRGLGDPEAVRRQAGVVSAEDLAKAGYAVALRDNLPPEEMKHIIAWYEAIVGEAPQE